MTRLSKHLATPLLLVVVFLLGGCGDSDAPKHIEQLKRNPADSPEAATWFASLPKYMQKAYARQMGQILLERNDGIAFVFAFGADEAPYPWAMMVGGFRDSLRLKKGNFLRKMYREGEWAVFWFGTEEYRTDYLDGQVVFEKHHDPKREPMHPPGLWATGEVWRYVGPSLPKYGPESAKEIEAMAAIRELGGVVEVDPRVDEYRVDSVYFVRATTATDSVLEQVKHLTKLRSLFLESGNITDAGLENLSRVTHLEKLTLTSTAVTDAGLEKLNGLGQLQDLSLNRTRITDAGLKHLQGMTELRILKLERTLVSDVGLAYLKDLKRLEVLNLACTAVTDAGLVHLKDLTEMRELYLSCTKVSDAGLHHLKGLARLRELAVGLTRVSDEGAQEFQKTVPGCSVDR